MSNGHYEMPRLVGPAPQSGGAAMFSVHTVLIGIRCWWHIALPLGLLLAAAAAVIVYYFSTPTYTASAWVLIREKPILLVANATADDPRKFVQNQIELLRSPPVLDPVASDPGVASAPELANNPDPSQYLRNKLRIRSLGGSDYFVIEFTSKSAEKAAVIVNKVAQEYLALQQKRENKSTQRTIELLQEQQQAQQAEVKQQRDRLQRLSKQIYGKEAFPTPKREDRLLQSDPAAELWKQWNQAEVEHVTLSFQIKAEKELFQQESFEPPQAEVEGHVQAVPRVQELRARIQANRAKMAEHKAVSRDLQHNSLYAQLEKQVKDDEASLEKSLADLRPGMKKDIEKYSAAKRQDEIVALQKKLDRLTFTKGYLADKLKEERANQQELGGDTLAFKWAQDDYTRASDLMDAFSNRILTMQIEQRAPERVEIFREATIPTRADEEIPYRKMTMAAWAALLVPFGLAVGIEMLYRRVSSREQLESAGQIAVVAEVTTLPTRIKSRHKDTGDNHRLQLFEESVDGLRTYLALVESMRGHKVLAVTSAISREGKTSLAAQLAISVANATNRPTLLIDGDMRSPDMHRIFGTDRGPGLSEVLKGECPAEEAIETSFSDTLHLLTAGDLDISPHRILGNGKFAELIVALREMYDTIIIDTPPILPASESLLMASTADAAVLCVRRDFSRVDQVAEAFARLRSAGVKTAGAVLNGVPAFHYAYRYGSYYYNRHRFADGRQDDKDNETS